MVQRGSKHGQMQRTSFANILQEQPVGDGLPLVSLAHLLAGHLEDEPLAQHLHWVVDGQRGHLALRPGAAHGQVRGLHQPLRQPHSIVDVIGTYSVRMT